MPVFLAGFKNKIGKSNAATSTEIIEKIKQRYNVELSDSTVRKVVAFIRDNDLVDGLLVASSEGYYISHDPNDILRWIKSLEGRQNKIGDIKRKAIDKYKKYSQGKQQPLYQ